jgi:hypothetical protein
MTGSKQWSHKTVNGKFSSDGKVRYRMFLTFCFDWMSLIFPCFLFVRFEVPKAVIMSSSIFWDVTLCSQLKVKRRFGWKFPFNLATLVSCLAKSSSETSLTLNALNGVTSQYRTHIFLYFLEMKAQFYFPEASLQWRCIFPRNVKVLQVEVSNAPEVRTATGTGKPLYLFIISLLQTEFTQVTADNENYLCCYVNNPGISVENKHYNLYFLFEKQNETGTWKMKPHSHEKGILGISANNVEARHQFHQVSFLWAPGALNSSYLTGNTHSHRYKDWLVNAV